MGELKESNQEVNEKAGVQYQTKLSYEQLEQAANQLMQANQQAQQINQQIEEDFVRHIVLSSIASYNRRFRKEFGSLVICCDSVGGNYWRKEIFLYC